MNLGLLTRAAEARAERGSSSMIVPKALDSVLGLQSKTPAAAGHAGLQQLAPHWFPSLHELNQRKDLNAGCMLQQATTTAAASSSATFPSCDRIKQFQEQSLITCKDMTSLRLGGAAAAGTSSTSSSISWASPVDQLQLQAHATAGDHHIHATQEIAATTQLQPDHQAGCCIRFIDFLGVGA